MKNKPSVNVVQRLRMRQLRGHLKPTVRAYPVCRSLFGKIPGRLGVPLKQIVDANALHEEGHVFLGFSKDGQFVLSYTLNVFADDHTAYPVYVYKLFWWRFRDNQPMQKVSEVRLFGEKEGIRQDLYLAVCSWPTDTSKVMVYGCCTNSKAEQEDEKLLCYVTITGVPSNNPCQKCLHCKYTAEPSTHGFSALGQVWTPPELLEDLSITDPAPPNCIQHGFAVHTKFELAPPFPSFSPKHSLAKDGVAVLNTGDSIMALAVSIGQGKSTCTSLYSPLHSRSSGSTLQYSNDSIPHCSQSESPGSKCSSKLTRTCTSETCTCSQTFNKSTTLEMNRKTLNWGDCTCTNVEHNNSTQSVACQSAVTQSTGQYSSHQELCNTSGKHLGSSCGESNVKYQEWPFSQQSQESSSFKQSKPVIDQLEIVGCAKTFTATLPSNSKDSNNSTRISISQGDEDGNKQEKQTVHIADANSQVQKQAHLKRRCHLHLQEHSVYGDDLQSMKHDNKPSGTKFGPSTKSVGTTPMCKGNNMKVTSEILTNSQQGEVLHGLHECTRMNKSRSWFLDEDDSNIGCDIAQQCPYHHTSLDISTIQGSVCTIQECTCNLQGFHYSVRYYIEKNHFLDMDQSIEIEAHDYDSMLPVVVCGTQTQPMVMANKAAINEGPFIEMKQLTMDAEHYICDTIRTCAPWGRRYIAFTDYDMQILEVCPDSSCVIVMIMVLIRAWPETKVQQDIFEFDDETTNATPKFYQTGFKFTWNLKTGKQTTFEVNELVEFDQSQLRKAWNPGREICQNLQKKWSLPQGHAKGVHVLTNEAVFKNKSLKRLLDPEHYVAIVLT